MKNYQVVEKGLPHAARQRRKMVILIPFLLLKLKKVIEKERTPENPKSNQSFLTPSNVHFIRTYRFLSLFPSDIFVELSQSLKKCPNPLEKSVFQ